MTSDELAQAEAPAVTDAEGRPTLASLQMLNLPRYRHLVELAGWLRNGAYPPSYTFEQALTEHRERGITTPEDERYLRLIEAERRDRVEHGRVEWTEADELAARAANPFLDD